MPKPANREIIAVDIDEVLAPHFQDLMTWYNQTYGASLTLANNHPADNDFEPWGTQDMLSARRRVHKFFETAEFKSTQPFKESIKVLKKLGNTRNLVVVTSRDNMLEEMTHDWLNQHFNKIFSGVHFTARYSVEGKARSKADVCTEIGAKYLIDDSLEQALETAAKGIKVLLFGDYPWNQSDNLPRNVVRANGWREVLEYFDEKG